SLVGSKFQKSDFSGADLRGASLVDADLSGAQFDGADLTGCNLRGANVTGVNFSKAKGYDPSAQSQTTLGPALKKLDQAIGKAKRIQFEFRLAKPIDGDDRINADSGHLQYGWAVNAPVHIPRTFGRANKPKMSEELLLTARNIGNVTIRFETLQIKTTKSKTDAKELRDVLIDALCEAFSQEKP